MKKHIAIIVLLAAIACRDAAGPSGGESPGGKAVVWFNGLSANADVWYPESDSLIPGAWTTGSAPNQILSLGNSEFAVLSSLGGELFTGSVDEPGKYLLHVTLPGGTNPYCFAVKGDRAWTTLLLADSVIEIDLSSGTPVSGFPTRNNPSGVTCTDSQVLVSYSNWPDASSPGGVSVYNSSTYDEVSWLDTGVNSSWITLQPTGLIHCYSTTYQNDGKISVINPAEGGSVVSSVNCGGAPGEAIYHNGSFISPDGWGEGGLVIYDETGDWERVPLTFSPSGLAIQDETLYATSFGCNMVFILDPDTFSVTDSIPSGGEGPQGIIAVDP